MEKWEYKIEEYTTKVDAFKNKGGFFSTGQRLLLALKKFDQKTTLTTEQVENGFNDLGNDGWEMCGILPFTSGKIGIGGDTERIYLIFKRKKI